MRMTKRIIIRIIVAVAVAFILSKFKVIGLINVSAKTANTTFTYNNVLITQNQIDFNFTSPFATNMKRGTMKTNVVISSNILPNTGDIPVTLRQAIVYNGTSTNVCSIGSVNTGSIFSEGNQGQTNRLDVRSTTYTLECEVTPNPKIERVTLYFSGSMNSARLSFGPNVSFRENDFLLQNETCTDSPNLLPNLAISSTVNGLSFSVNSDKSITINGTATARTFFNINGSQQLVNLESGSSYTLSTTSILPTGIRMTIRKYSVAEDISTISSNSNKINFVSNYSGSSFVYLSIVEGTSFNNFTIYPQLEKGSFSSYIPFGEIQCKNKQDLALEESQKQTQAQQETNDTIKNSDTTEANSKADSFFSGFESTSMGGVSNIITSPFRLLNSLISSQCSSLIIPLPFVDDDVEIPCMSTIYSKYPTFYSLWQLITTGLISYNVAINLYSKIKNMQNPKNDKIEVLNL